jgi:hypothetical protein
MQTLLKIYDNTFKSPIIGIRPIIASTSITLKSVIKAKKTAISFFYRSAHR